jgi:predicted ATPase/transcriptional regulator with XRE-family HTH domain
MSAEASLGARLRALRERAGLSREALAERAGLGVGTLAAIERDERQRPHPHTLSTLAEALGLGPAERGALLEGARARSPTAPVAAPRTASAEPGWQRGNVPPGGRRAPRTAASGESGARHNLPSGLSSLVGRDRELADVVRLLQTNRLVTLTGVGGVGKTRLALSIAAGAVKAYPDGVWLASLAPLVDPALVPHTVAAAVGVSERGGQSLIAILTDALSQARTLLVLDNCEHLIQACAELVETLLLGSGDLTILATSREPLRVTGEVTQRVSSLGLPPSPPPPPEQLSQYDAARLFVERALASRPDFQVTTANAPAVAEVCWRLDGIPLAIELAAGWVRTLSVEQLAARLDDRFRLLVGGNRTAPQRQQTLRGAIEWSYGLLSEPERRLFAALCVFVGGCSLEAVEAVCTSTDVAGTDLLWLLRQLVDKSLVLVDESADGTRYHLLESLRAYGKEQAQLAGELTDLERRYVEWCLAFAEASPPQQVHPKHVAALDKEQDNLRAALRWCIETGDAQAGLRLGVGVYPLWYVRGRYSEGQAWLDELLAMAGAEVPTATRARALAYAGHLATCRSDYDAADTRLEAALATARQVHAEGEVGFTLLCLGNAARARGELDRAEELYVLARATHQQLGNHASEAITVGNHALLLEERGEIARAEVVASEGLAIARAADHQQAASRMLGLLGRVAMARGDYLLARKLLEQSLRLQREQADQQGLAWTVLELARLAHAEGQDAQAGRLLAEGLGRARAADDRRTLARGMEEVALVVAGDQPARAVSLAAAAAELRRSIGAELVPAERARLRSWETSVRAVLGESAYGAARAEGQHYTLEEAISLALGLTRAEG